jgi:transketolase
MATRIVMPSFGMFTSEGKVAAWRVSSGARIQAGDPIVDVETEKAVQEVIAPAGGILHVVAAQGAVVSEEQLLGYVLGDDEAVPAPDAPPSAAPRAGAEPARVRASGRESADRVPATAEARRLAAHLGVDLSAVVGTGPRGRIVAGDVKAAAAADGPADPALADLARRIRRHLVVMTSRGNASHIGSCLSIADMLAVLYGRVLRVDPRQPAWPDRDRFILSKGHGCAALYAVLAERGFFPLDWLDTYYADGTRLPGHATHRDTPGVELSTGSLGHGLPVGCGMALAAKRDDRTHRVIVMLSDGECDEGSTWEAALFAPHHRLDNLVVLVDYNKIQSLGNVKDVLDLDPLAAKWRSFGWCTVEIDGHDLGAVERALVAAPAESGRPTCIVAHTVKGKGVSFMEHNLQFHYTPPRGDEIQRALDEIERHA